MNKPLKMLMLIAAVLLVSSSCYAQGLERGNLLGLHVMTVTLKPGVTIEEFKNVYIREVLPEYEKNWPGLKGYLLESFRHDSKNKFAIVWLFKTEADRNRNFDADDKPNELEKAALEKVKPIEDKLQRMYGTYTVQYTHEDDWVVQ